MRHQQNRINIGIFGYGNMGRAIASQLKNSSLISSKVNLAVYSLGINRIYKTRIAHSLEELLDTCRIVFLCIKPQDFYLLKPVYAKAGKKPVVISIMAGVNIANIKKIITGTRIVRIMPNLPLQIGRGVIGWYLKKAEFKPKELKLLDKIFSSFGMSVYLKKEKKVDAITAISGSGPAYVFLFMDALIKAAIKLGFNQDEAIKIVRQTIDGSISFTSHFDSADLKKLIQTVKSPGGTTEAALKTLNINNFYKRWQEATARAYQRAQEISSYEIK